MQPVGRDHEQRWQSDSGRREQRACDVTDEVAEHNRPEAVRSRRELAKDERAGELLGIGRGPQVD